MIALGFILYNNYSNKELADGVDSKNTTIIVKTFLNKMIPQQIESAQLSNIVMRDLDITEPKYRILAANISDRDSFRVEQMKGLYMTHLGGVYGSDVYKPIMKDMSEIKGDVLAKSYIKEMIKHHKKAIDDAKDYIKIINKVKKANSNTEDGFTITTSHPAIDDSYDLAVEIVKQYEKDIEEMKSF